MTAHATTTIVLGVIGGRQLMTTEPSVDPTAGAGVAAPIGSIYLRSNAAAPLYSKTTAPDTGWTPLALTTALASAAPQPLVNPKYGGANATVALGTNAARAMFIGYAYRAFAAGSTFTMQWRVTIAGSNFTWGEIALGKGAVAPNSSPSVTPVGFTDVAAQMAAGPASYATSVAVAGGQSIAAGDGLWAIFAKASTGSPTLSALGAIDDILTGIQGTTVTAGWRPSLQLGVAETFATDPASLGIKTFTVAPYP